MSAMNTRRRQKVREYPRAEHIAWRTHGVDTHRQASVIDRSESGIRLQAKTGPRPAEGDCIRIASRRHAYPKLARVVRVSEDHGAFEMGCRWVSSIDHQARDAGRQRPRRIHHRR
ncbi:MAG: PilZ domain-containing protein [Phycisphaeraceae bacterium]|nr:PilZ domain-containing protein [Phycisphaeraceae bacterium]MCB9848826.1 PilZ domain-containing protein [Phycisphaeraceae bacterium]